MSDMNKIYDLLEKVYIDLQDTKKDLNVTKETVQNRFDKLGGQLTFIEQDHGNKLEALLDSCQQVYEKQQEHDKRFDILEKKIDQHDIEIYSIKRKKQANKIHILHK